MLDVDIERIEAGGAGDAGDLHGADEPHRHRRHHFVPLELLLDIVVQESRICTAGPPSCLGLGYAPDAMLPGVDPRSEQARTIHELRNRLQVDPRRGVGRGGRLRGPALDRPGPTVVWQSRLAVKLMARRPPHSWVSTGSPRS